MDIARDSALRCHMIACGHWGFVVAKLFALLGNLPKNRACLGNSDEMHVVKIFYLLAFFVCVDLVCMCLYASSYWLCWELGKTVHS